MCSSFISAQSFIKTSKIELNEVIFCTKFFENHLVYTIAGLFSVAYTWVYQKGSKVRDVFQQNLIQNNSADNNILE